MENSDDCVFKSNTYEKRSQMTEIMSRCGKMA